MNNYSNVGDTRFSESFPLIRFKVARWRSESSEFSDVLKSKVLKGRHTELGLIPFLTELKPPTASK